MVTPLYTAACDGIIPGPHPETGVSRAHFTLPPSPRVDRWRFVALVLVLTCIDRWRNGMIETQPSRHKALLPGGPRDC